MRSRCVLALAMLSVLAACGDPLDRQVTRDQWYSPGADPTYLKLTQPDRTAFSTYRNHVVRLNFGSADNLTAMSWKEAIARGYALRAREEDAVKAVRAALQDPSVRVDRVKIGRSNAVCGRIAFPRTRANADRQFIVFPDNQVEVSPPAEDFAADQQEANARWQTVNTLLRECEPDTSALPRSSAPQSTVATGTSAPATDNPTSSELRAAFDAGHAGDINTLREIVSKKSDTLLDKYLQGSSGEAGRVTPEVEEILLRAAGQGHRPANWPLVLPSFPQCTYRYSNPSLRAALLDSAKRSPSGLGSGQLLCGALDVDDDAIGLLATVKYEHAITTLLRYAAQRKLAAAVPAVVALQSAVSGQRQSSRTAAAASATLLAIGTPDALAALNQRVAALAARRDSPASIEALDLLESLAQVDPDPRIAVGTIVPLWGAFPQRETRAAFAKWASFWDAREAAPLLLRDLEGGGPSYLAESILRMGDPAAWKRLDAWARTTDTGRAASADLRSRIAEAASDPKAATAAQAKRARSEAYWHATRDKGVEEDIVRAARGADPATFVTLQRARIERKVAASRTFADLPEAADAIRDLPKQYAELAGYARWVARDPAGAVALYESASAAGGKEFAKFGFDPFELAVADTLRFDLNDPAGAAARLRKMRESNGPGTPLEAGMRAWIDDEIGFLEGRRDRSGADEMCGVATLWFRADGLPGVRDEAVDRLRSPAEAKDPEQMARALESLSPSIFHLYASFKWWPALGTPERIIRFGKVHDPSGTSFKCAMHLVQVLARLRVEHLDESDRRRNLPPWSDADFALVTSAALQVVGAPPQLPSANPALASPDATWNVYIAALKRGDLAAANACLTSDLRRKLAPVFHPMTKEQVQAVGHSFTSFRVSSAGGSVSDGLVTRNGRSAFVSFVKQGKEWLIADM